MSMEDMDVTDRSMPSLDVLHALQTNTTEKLSIAWRKLGDHNVKPLLNELSAESALLIKDIMNVTYELQQLSLSYNPFGDEGLVHIASGLGGFEDQYDQDAFEGRPAEGSSRSTTICFLKKLWLGQVGCTHFGAEKLAEALAVNKELISLHLNGNIEIGNTGAKYLADGLKRNKNLKLIDLARCGLGDEGIASIFSALASNKTLLSLDISGSEIGDKAVEAFEYMSTQNQSLFNIFMRQGKFADHKLLKRVLKAIVNLAQLQVVDLEGCQMLQKYPKTVSGLLQRHKSLTLNTRRHLNDLCRTKDKMSSKYLEADKTENREPNHCDEQEFRCSRAPTVVDDECINADDVDLEGDTPLLENPVSGYITYPTSSLRRSHSDQRRTSMKSRTYRQASLEGGSDENVFRLGRGSSNDRNSYKSFAQSSLDMAAYTSTPMNIYEYYSCHLDGEYKDNDIYADLD